MSEKVTQLPMALAWKQRQNFVAFDGGRIVVQACDIEYAHLGVFVDGKSAMYYHVNLPGLERQYERQKKGFKVMTPAEFDEIITKHRAELIAVLARLNAAEG